MTFKEFTHMQNSQCEDRSVIVSIVSMSRLLKNKNLGSFVKTLNLNCKII